MLQYVANFISIIKIIQILHNNNTFYSITLVSTVNYLIFYFYLRHINEYNYINFVFLNRSQSFTLKKFSEHVGSAQPFTLTRHSSTYNMLISVLLAKFCCSVPDFSKLFI